MKGELHKCLQGGEGGGEGGRVALCLSFPSGFFFLSPPLGPPPPPDGCIPPQESPSPEQAKPADASGEKEEEEAFLVSLYKFMKERHTPIERIPHLGFKQSTYLGAAFGMEDVLGTEELLGCSAGGHHVWLTCFSSFLSS